MTSESKNSSTEWIPPLTHTHITKILIVSGKYIYIHATPHTFLLTAALVIWDVCIGTSCESPGSRSSTSVHEQLCPSGEQVSHFVQETSCNQFYYNLFLPVTVFSSCHARFVVMHGPNFYTFPVPT